MNIKEAIRSRAYELGFQLAGFALPSQSTHIEAYKKWLSDGNHGEMAYLASESAVDRRQNLEKTLPGVKTVLVLGARYAPPDASGTKPGFGKVASYALGDDYHEVLPDRMRLLVEYTEQLAGRNISNRWYTDTGPVLERELAQRAGLGWIGKNTCLINPRMGSYFFLAEILMDLELEPDLPFAADHCGTCRRCIEACPTGCILSNRTLDSRRCISYLTIELKGVIPHEMRQQMGNLVFGCDICQQVCPWNQRFASVEVMQTFIPRENVASPDLKTEIQIKTSEFNRKFRNNPVKRTKRRGYLRNIAVAAGNSQENSLVKVLGEVLMQETEPLVRIHAAWALARLQTREAQALLQDASVVEQDPGVLQEMNRSLE